MLTINPKTAQMTRKVKTKSPSAARASENERIGNHEADRQRIKLPVRSMNQIGQEQRQRAAKAQQREANGRARQAARTWER